MFKKPFEVKIDAQPIEVEHKVAVKTSTFVNTEILASELEKKATRVLIIGAAAYATSQILVHIAKTKI